MQIINVDKEIILVGGVQFIRRYDGNAAIMHVDMQIDYVNMHHVSVDL